MFKKLMHKKIFCLFLVSAVCLSLLLLPLASYAGTIGTGVSVANDTSPVANDTLPVVINTAFPQPPANFDPLTATPVDLQKYGFPAKPTKAEDLVAWENAMKHAKQYVKPIQEPSLSRYGLLGTLYTGAIVGNANWAGYVVDSGHNSNASFAGTCANWTQPSYVNNTWTAFWTGVGGVSPSTIILQAGATSDAPAYGNATKPYEFWIEDYKYNTPGTGAIYEAAPALNPGNEVFVAVQYVGSSSGFAFLENETMGQYTNLNFNAPYYDGSSAEWVNEEANYSNWGSVNFWGCGDSTVIDGSNSLFTPQNYWRYVDGRNTGSPTWAVPTEPPILDSGAFTINTPANPGS